MLYSAQVHERLASLHHVAACNAHHALPARCAHWLLELHERLGDVIPMTHVGLASLLGVRRAGVTVALGKLDVCGAIRQRRGRIVVTDPTQLRAHACACPIGGGANTSLSGLLLDGDLAAENGPRDWVAREMRAHANEGRAGDSQWIRREATLRVCRSVLSQGQAILRQ